MSPVSVEPAAWDVACPIAAARALESAPIFTVTVTVGMPAISSKLNYFFVLFFFEHVTTAHVSVTCACAE